MRCPNPTSTGFCSTEPLLWVCFCPVVKQEEQPLAVVKREAPAEPETQNWLGIPSGVLKKDLGGLSRPAYLTLLNEYLLNENQRSICNKIRQRELKQVRNLFVVFFK